MHCSDSNYDHEWANARLGTKTEVIELATNEDAGELTQLLMRIQTARDEEACTQLWESIHS